MAIYVPTTPNLRFPHHEALEVIELVASVDEALKYIISMGVVDPVKIARQKPTPKCQMIQEQLKDLAQLDKQMKSRAPNTSTSEQNKTDY